jgi:hypothetical protein
MLLLLAARSFSACGQVFNGTDEVVIVAVSFVGCSAASDTGSAIHVTEYTGTPPLSITDCTFVSCTSPSKAGAIYVYTSAAPAAVIGCRFESCVSNVNGGAMYLMAAAVSVLRCSCALCRAGTTGSSGRLSAGTGPVNCSEIASVGSVGRDATWLLAGYSTATLRFEGANLTQNTVTRTGSGVEFRDARVFIQFC